MSDLNQVTMLGRLTRDPELRYLPNQTVVCNFGLANGHKFKTASGELRESTCFVECVLFGKRGEALNQHFSKGKQILISGRLDFQTWDDKNGGGKRSKHVIQVQEFNFTGSKGDGNAGGGRPAPSRNEDQRQPAYEAAEESQINDDDIPF